MYSHQQHPFGGNDFGGAWPFADSRGRSRLQRPPRSIYDLPLRGESPFDGEELAYADPRLQAARELEQQRLAQEYARALRQHQQQQQQRHRRQHPRHFGFVPQEEDSDDNRDEDGLNGFGFVDPHVSEAQRQRALAAAALRKQQQQQEYQQALERERKLREVQERRFLEQQRQMELQKEQLRQRQAAQLAARQQKERDYIDYIRQLQQQADQVRPAHRSPLMDSSESSQPDDVEMHDQSDDDGEEERYFHHPLFGLVPERQFLRRSRSHSPPLRRGPAAGYTLADLARAHALQQKQQQQQQRNSHKARQQHEQIEQPTLAQLVSPQASIPITFETSQSSTPKPVAPPRFSDSEAAALFIQAAVRGFLVRKQKVLPKLKEIAKVRQTANMINNKYEGLTEKWQQVEKMLSEYRDSLPEDRGRFVFPEKRERQQVLIYEEEMLRALISLDNITAGRSDIVREARKKLVGDIQGYLNKLDHMKLIVKEVNSLSEETSTQSSPSAPSTPVDSNSMDVDSSAANLNLEEPATPVEAQQIESEVEEPSEDVAMDDTPIETSQTESPQLSQDDISLLMRTLAANGLSIEDFRPSATPRQITLTTLAL